MPAQEKRKIMKHGTSGVVAIPASYRKYHHLNPGDEVQVLYDGIVLIVPKEREQMLIEKGELIDKLLT